MTNVKTTERGRVTEIVNRYGSCVELVSMDPNFYNISVSLYVKDGVGTVWTFSQKPGVEERIGKIRDQLIALGGMESIEGTHDQAKFSCGQLHGRPMKFLMRRAVEKDPNFTLSEDSVKDLRSPLMLGTEASELDGRWVYRVTAEGVAPNEAQRLRAVTAGMVRYGEMEKVGDDGVSFTCGYRHDELARVVLPYARNVTGVEDMLAADDLRGQMTTGTLGFTPPT